MFELSPEAVKAQRQGVARSKMWARRLAPRLARTEHLAIILRPEYGGHKRQQAWFDWLAKNLPQFVFNAKFNRWQAPLVELVAAHVALPEAGLSDGARAYLSEQETSDGSR